MSDTKRLNELDSLRGFAALSVCFFHFGFYNYGITGVDLFFIISGFVIYMSIGKVSTLKEFVISRGVRLYPLYWASLFISLTFCGVCYFNWRWNYLLGNITMLQPLFKSDYVAGVYWTLYIEMTFYVFMAILWLTKALKNVEIIILIIVLLNGSIHGLFIFKSESWPNYERFFIIIRGAIPLISHFHLFAAGIIFYQIFSDRLTQFRIILLGMCFSIVLIVHNIGGRNFYFTNVPEHLILSAVYFSLFALIILKKLPILKHKFFTFFGYISYALYLFHGTLGIWVENEVSLYLEKTYAILFGIGVSIIFSYLATAYFDNPVRMRLKKFLSH